MYVCVSVKTAASTVIIRAAARLCPAEEKKSVTFAIIIS